MIRKECKTTKLSNLKAQVQVQNWSKEEIWTLEIVIKKVSLQLDKVYMVEYMELNQNATQQL